MLLGLVAATAGCFQDTDTAEPLKRVATQNHASRVVGSNRRRPTEDPYVALAQADSTIAGLYYDPASQSIVIPVVDSTRGMRAMAAAKTVFSGGQINLPREMRSAPVRVRAVQYSFQDLSDWRDKIVDNLLGSTGVVSDAIDVVENRIVVGIDRSYPGGEGDARQRLMQLGVPLGAVHFVADGIRRFAVAPAPRNAPLPTNLFGTRPTTMATDNRTQSDTLAGGFAVQVVGAGGCTAGLVVERSGTRGLITASHCTTTMFGLNTSDTLYFASTSTNMGEPVGNESVDPSGSSCGAGCTSGRVSDASFFSFYTPAYPSRRGSIIRTAARDSGQASTANIDASNPWININSDAVTMVVGMRVHKIGEHSGWTYGTISNTCSDGIAGLGGNNYKDICQVYAQMWTELGDSGADVFAWDGADGAQFLGVISIFGSATCNTTCPSVGFSPLSAIATNLGAINVASEITVGAPSVSITLDGAGRPVLSWPAVSTSHTSATTEYTVSRAVWDASTYTWGPGGSLGTQIASLTGTSYTDTAVPFTPTAVTGATKPNDCDYSQVTYWVGAYNKGIWAVSPVRYVQGPADGASPGGRECQ